MENRAHALAAGLFVILLGLAGVATIWWVSGSGVVTKNYYLVTQRAINGLNPQAQVRYRGIRSGKVESIEIDRADKHNILVRISLDASVTVTRSTTSQLAFQGVTGLAYILLDDAGDSSETLTAGSGDLPRIPLKPTLIDSLTDQAVVLVQQLSETSGRANRLLDERNINNLSRTIDNLAVASDGLKELPALLAQTKLMLSDDNVKRLSRILAHVETTAGEAAPLAVEMRGLVASLQTLSLSLDRAVVGVGDDLTTRTLPDIDGMARDVRQTSRQLRQLLDQVERAPQSLIFGRPAQVPGPGEAGFNVSQ